MTSVVNPQEKLRRYTINIAGVEFHVNYEPGDGWVMTTPRDRNFVLRAKKARSLASDRALSKIQREVIKLLCGEDKACAEEQAQKVGLYDIYDALKKQFISRVAVRRVAVPADSASFEVAHTPAFYSPALNVAGILVYREMQHSNEHRIEPRLIVVEYSEDGETRLVTAPSIHLVEAIAAPLRFGNTYLYVRAPAYKEAIAAGDIGAAEDVASELAMEMGVALLGPAWPPEPRVLYWLDRTKSNPEAWLQWLHEKIAYVLDDWVWSKLRGRRLLAMIPLAIMFSTVFDFTLHIVFSGRRGAGKSLHIATLAALSPYTIRSSDATTAVLDRLRTHALAMAFDEFTAREQEIYWYIRTYTQTSRRIVMAPDRKGATSFAGGWGVLLPDVGQFAEQDGYGAAMSRSIVFHLLVDKSKVKLADPIRYIQEKYRRTPICQCQGPDGKDVALYIDDVYALQAALFLRLARKVYDIYREIDREVEAKAKKGELGVEGRRLQAFAPLLAIARLIGPSMEAEVWKYMRETSEMSPPQTFVAVIDALRYIIEQGGSDPEIREQVRKLELDGGRYVLLIKPAAILDVAAKMVREGATVAVTERARIEEGENVTLKRVELWPRRTLPTELQSVERFERWIARETYYAKHLLGYARDKTRRDRKHLVVTPDVVDLFEAEAWQHLETAEEVFRKICSDVKALVDTYPNVIHSTHPILRECAPWWSGVVERREPLDKGGGGAGVERGVERGAETNLPSTNVETERGTAESEPKADSVAEVRSTNNNTSIDIGKEENPASVNTPPPAPVALHQDKCQTEGACSTTALQSAESFEEKNKDSNTQLEKVADQPTGGERWTVKPEDVVRWVKSLGKRAAERET